MCDSCGCDSKGTSKSGGREHRIIKVEKDVLARNSRKAELIRRRALDSGNRIVNFIGSPGAGKTELCVALINALKDRKSCIVIEGDLATDNDARRIASTGANVHQIVTGTGCHLSADDVVHSLSHLPETNEAIIFVENVGNLVCPSMFDIGESMRIVCLSVTEGEDKPEKYPITFREANAVAITKSDLMPYVDFNFENCSALIQRVNPKAPVFLSSTKTGDGIDFLAAHILEMWSEE